MSAPDQRARRRPHVRPRSSRTQTVHLSDQRGAVGALGGQELGGRRRRWGDAASPWRSRARETETAWQAAALGTKSKQAQRHPSALGPQDAAWKWSHFRHRLAECKRWRVSSVGAETWLLRRSGLTWASGRVSTNTRRPKTKAPEVRPRRPNRALSSISSSSNRSTRPATATTSPRGLSTNPPTAITARTCSGDS